MISVRTPAPEGCVIVRVAGAREQAERARGVMEWGKGGRSEREKGRKGERGKERKG